MSQKKNLFKTQYRKNSDSQVIFGYSELKTGCSGVIVCGSLLAQKTSTNYAALANHLLPEIRAHDDGVTKPLLSFS